MWTAKNCFYKFWFTAIVTIPVTAVVRAEQAFHWSLWVEWRRIGVCNHKLVRRRTMYNKTFEQLIILLICYLIWYSNENFTFEAMASYYDIYFWTKNGILAARNANIHSPKKVIKNIYFLEILRKQFEKIQVFKCFKSCNHANLKSYILKN